MPIDATGVYKYSSSDVVNSWHNLLNLGMSSVSNALRFAYSNSVVTATSHQDSVTKAQALKTKGASFSASSPLLIYRTDANWFSTYDGSSVKWVNRDSNTVWINNTAYKASGTWSVTNQPNWDTTSATHAIGNISFTLPFSVPSGWAVETFVVRCDSWAVASTASVSGTRVNVRLIQFNNNNKNLIKKIGWRLVKDA